MIVFLLILIPMFYCMLHVAENIKNHFCKGRFKLTSRVCLMNTF